MFTVKPTDSSVFRPRTKAVRGRASENNRGVEFEYLAAECKLIIFV